MFKLKIFVITTLATAFLTSCGRKSTADFSQEDNCDIQLHYIVNENLSSNSYSDVNGYFPKEGLIPTAEIAFKIAEPILIQLYGKEKIEEERPFSINLENNVWIIEGHLSEEFLGGVAYMEIRKTNGEILKVIHTK